MMTANDIEPRRLTGWKRLAAIAIPGGVLGGIVGFTSASRIDALFAGGKPDLSLILAMLVGAVYAITALVVLLGLVNTRVGAKFLNVADAEELEEQRGQLVGSGVAMLSIGIAFVLLALAEPAGPVAPMLAGEGALALLAVVIALSVHQMRGSDELMRTLSREAGSWAFNIFAAAGAIWAGAAHLGFAAAPEPLDFITGAGASMWLAIIIATARRGLLDPR